MKIVILVIIILLFVIIYLQYATYKKQQCGTVVKWSSEPIGKAVPDSTSLGGQKGSAPEGMGIGTILRSQLSESSKAHFDRYVLRVPAFVEQIPLPEEFDWHVVAPLLISDPVSQEDCGSCWAFSVCSMSSDRIRLLTKGYDLSTVVPHVTNDGKTELIINQLSAHLLAGCDFCDLKDDNFDVVNSKIIIEQGKCGKRCDGGVIEYALIYLCDNGMISHGCNDPAYQEQYKCHRIDNIFKTSLQPGLHCRPYKFKKPVHVSIYEDIDLNDADRLKENELAIKTEIYKYGPVSAGYMIYQDFYHFFENNPGGTYKETNKKFQVGGHAVVITGWGKDRDGTPVWHVRNSWGKTWNNDGYFKILRGKNFCSIESDVWGIIPSATMLEEEVEADRGTILLLTPESRIKAANPNNKLRVAPEKPYIYQTSDSL